MPQLRHFLLHNLTQPIYKQGIVPGVQFLGCTPGKLPYVLQRLLGVGQILEDLVLVRSVDNPLVVLAEHALVGLALLEQVLGCRDGSLELDRVDRLRHGCRRRSGGR